MLHIASIEKSFGDVQVLKKIDLEARQGEFLALLGPSGCGKSTLLGIISGLESASSGDIIIDRQVVTDLEPKDRDIAMVFQSYALYPSMTVAENLRFGMKVRGVPRESKLPQSRKCRGSSISRICSIASPRSSRAASASASRWAAPLSATRRFSCSTKDAAMNRQLIADTPLARMADPREVAYAILFLAGDESAFVTGAELVVDGGYTIR